MTVKLRIIRCESHFAPPELGRLVGRCYKHPAPTELSRQPLWGFLFLRVGNTISQQHINGVLPGLDCLCGPLRDPQCLNLPVT